MAFVKGANGLIFTEDTYSNSKKQKRKQSNHRKYFCPKYIKIVNVTKVKHITTPNNHIKISCCCDGKNSTCDNECLHIKEWIVNLTVSRTKK